MKRFRAVPLRQLRDLQAEGRAGAVAGARPRRRRPIVAVDLGYAPKRPTTGVFLTNGPDRLSLRFGDAVRRVADAWVGPASRLRPVLVLEAPLSARYAADGCPTLRRPPETNAYPWFAGTGAATALAALEFLRALDARLGTKVVHRVDLVEAFLPASIAARSLGQKSLVAWKVARAIHDGFPEARPHHDEAWRPLSPLVGKAPPILANGPVRTRH